MVIVLRLDGGGDILELEEPSDLRRFHVRIEGDHGPGRIASAFASTGLGDFESAERAMVSVARVRALAEESRDYLASRCGWELDVFGLQRAPETKYDEVHGYLEQRQKA